MFTIFLRHTLVVNLPATSRGLFIKKIVLLCFFYIFNKGAELNKILDR